MSRGLSELEEEDTSLSEAGDRDIMVDEVGDDSEETSREGQTGTENNRGHMDDGLENDTHSIASKTEDINGDNNNSHHKDRGQHYAALLANMNEMELNRYEAYCRSCIPRNKMKKVLMMLSSLPIHDDKILIVVCSLAKMFVGQIIKESRSLALSMGDDGQLQSHHIRKAFRKLESDGGFLRRQSRKPFFKYSL